MTDRPTQRSSERFLCLSVHPNHLIGRPLNSVSFSIKLGPDMWVWVFTTSELHIQTDRPTRIVGGLTRVLTLWYKPTRTQLQRGIAWKVDVIFASDGEWGCGVEMVTIGWKISVLLMLCPNRKPNLHPSNYTPIKPLWPIIMRIALSRGTTDPQRPIRISTGHSVSMGINLMDFSPSRQYVN